MAAAMMTAVTLVGEAMMTAAVTLVVTMMVAVILAAAMTTAVTLVEEAMMTAVGGNTGSDNDGGQARRSGYVNLPTCNLLPGKKMTTTADAGTKTFGLSDVSDISAGDTLILFDAAREQSVTAIKVDTDIVY